MLKNIYAMPNKGFNTVSRNEFKNQTVPLKTTGSTISQTLGISVNMSKSLLKSNYQPGNKKQSGASNITAFNQQNSGSNKHMLSHKYMNANSLSNNDLMHMIHIQSSNSASQLPAHINIDVKKSY